MKIGHYQLQCVTGDLDANVSKVLAGLAEADAQQLEIVSFPESMLTGYFTDATLAKKNSLEVEGPEISDLLSRSAKFKATFMVGFNEKRGEELFNTVLIAETGKLLGTYSKVFVCFDYFSQGRSFPVFKRGGFTFGVIICADGGYIEPARILGLKGADIIFAPHYNYIDGPSLLNHYQMVRSHHIARAVDNGVWFVRGNNVCADLDEGMDRIGVGYGDSYIIDPRGEMVVRTLRHNEQLISYDVFHDDSPFIPNGNCDRDGIRRLGKIMTQTFLDTEPSAPA